MKHRKFHEEGLIGFFGIIILIMFLMGLGLSGGKLHIISEPSTCSSYFIPGDRNSCPNSCTYRRPIDPVAESCDDNPNDDAINICPFTTGDQDSCSSNNCIYTAPVIGVTEACLDN